MVTPFYDTDTRGALVVCATTDAFWFSRATPSLEPTALTDVGTAEWPSSTGAVFNSPC